MFKVWEEIWESESGGHYGETRKAADDTRGRDNQKARVCMPMAPAFICMSARAASRSWIFRWKRDGRLRDMGLGPLNTISLAEARDRALACRKLKLDGGDPIEERRGRRQAARLQTAKAMTFRRMRRGLYRSASSWLEESEARRAMAGDACDLRLPGSRRAAGPGGRRRARHEGAGADLERESRRRRAGSAAASSWCSIGHRRAAIGKARTRPGGAAISKTCCRGGRRSARVEHHAALPYAELPAFMAELRQQEGIAARALEFAILTAARTGEVIGATWAEIDLEGRLWTIPAERMKAGREHRVPLSEPALAILRPIAEARVGRTRFPRQAGQAATVANGDVDAAAPHGPRWPHRARLSQHVLGLVRRAHQLSDRSRRNGAGARRRRQGRGSLPARRSVRQAPAACRCLGAVLRGAEGGRSGCADLAAGGKEADAMHWSTLSRGSDRRVCAAVRAHRRGTRGQRSVLLRLKLQPPFALEYR